MATSEEIRLCKQISNETRKDIINMTYSLGNVGAHLGGSLSMVEMLTTLYMCRIKYNINNPKWDDRDRVILSKGHGALALYPVLAKTGIIEQDKLKEFKQNGSLLGGHPSMNGLPGVEFSSGSLGQGLSLGVGCAQALRMRGNDISKVYVFLGDGECNEGSVWEAAASASHFKLNRIVAIVDSNHIQYDGNTEYVMNMQNMASKWSSFGWNAVEVDGHNVEELLNAFDSESDKPLVIIANTIKGKGIPFMEGDKHFHNARLSKTQYEQAMTELEGRL